MTKNTQKHQAVWEWLYDNVDISDLHFTQGEYNSKGECELNNQIVYTPETFGTDNWKKKYFRNKGVKEYQFTLSQYAPLISQSNTPTNIITLEAFEKIAEWVEKQNATKNFPSFPDSCKIIEVQAFPGHIAGADGNGVKIQFITKIIYEQQ